MQATVFSFDPDTRTGSVVLDSGRRMDFGEDVFAASGLRLLRTGQRVRIAVDADHVAAMTIVTLPPLPTEQT